MNLSEDLATHGGGGGGAARRRGRRAVDFSLWKVIDDEKRLQKEGKKTVKGTDGTGGGVRERCRGQDERRPGWPGGGRQRMPFIRI